MTDIWAEKPKPIEAERDGVMTIWDDSGEVIAKDCYRDGYLVSQDSGNCN